MKTVITLISIIFCLNIKAQTISQITTTSDSVYNFPVMAGGKAFFKKYGTQQLWVTDGTKSGYVMLHDFTNGGMYYSKPILSFGNKIIILAQDGSSGTAEVWVSDGTVNGTQQLTTTLGGVFDLPIITGGKVFFQKNGTQQLWVTNGTKTGSFMLHDFTNGAIYSMAALGNKIIISAKDGRLGSPGVWVSDGNTTINHNIWGRF